MRVLGYWLFYAIAGALVLAMAIGGGGDLGSEASRSPTRTRTKLISAASGVALAIAALGLYLLSDPAVNPSMPPRLLGIAAPAAAMLSIWSWTAIARDLRDRRPSASR